MHFRILLLLLFSYLAWPVTAQAMQQPLTLIDGQQRYVVDKALGLMRPTPKQLAIAEVAQRDDRFLTSPRGSSRSIGYTRNDIWARFTLTNNSQQDQWWIEADHSRVRSITLYQLTPAGQWHAQQLGAATPVQQRPIKHRANLFPVQIPSGTQQTFYLKLNTHTSVNLSVNVWQPAAFMAANDQHTSMLMLLCGVLLGIGIYYLLVTFALREALYLSFSLFILCFLVYFAAFNGFFLQYASQLSSDLVMRLIPITIAMTNFFYLAYSSQFLHTRHYSKLWHLSMRALMLVALGLTLASFTIDTSQASQWVTLLGPISSLSSLFAGLTVLYKGYKPARMFVLTLLIFCLTITVHNLGVLGYIPIFFNEMGLIITLMGVIPLLAVSFADRYNLLQQDHAASQERALTAERQLSQSLERQVAKRTQQLEQAKEQAEASSSAKGEFLAVMSHELRTPMTAVLGAAQLIDRASLTSENRHLLTTLDNASQQLLGLIDDILDISKVEKGELALNTQVFQPAQLLQDTVNLIQPTITQSALLLSLSTPTGVQSVIGDPVRVRQIVTNLITNAIKYTEQGEITVQAELSDQGPDCLKLLVSVTDTGCGIPEDMREQIFQPFEQAQPHNSTKSGIGLGLAICQRLVNAMGGEIGVDSTLRQGSRFWFHIPLKPAPQTLTVTTTESSSPSTLCILLADDTVINREIISQLLHRDGHHVISVGTGQAAVDTLSKHPIDLILMDIQMPVMDGLQATQKIRQLDDPILAATPIFALTASATRETMERCTAVGMNGWIGKPLKMDELYRTLNQYAGKQPPVATSSRTTEHSAAPSSYLSSFSPEEQQRLSQMQQHALRQAHQRLLAAKETSNHSELGRAAHSIANSAGILGLTELMQLAQKMEQYAQQQHPIGRLWSEYQQLYHGYMNQVETKPKSDLAAT